MKKIAVGDLGEFWYGDYKEPFVQLEGAVEGYPQGVLVKADDGKLLCAYCRDESKPIGQRGRTFHNLGNHARLKHGLPAPAYKRAVGLLQGSALVSERERMRSTALGFRRLALGQMPPISPKGTWAGGDMTHRPNGRADTVRTPEWLNKTGQCAAQMLAVCRSIQASGERVTHRALRARGISEKVVNRLYGDINGLRREVDESPGQFVGMGRGHKWTRNSLLALLRNLAAALGRTPARSDLRRYGLPATTTFANYFGSYKAACRAAGLPVNVPMPKPDDPDEDLRIVASFASLGSIDGVARRQGISFDRAVRILARYGIEGVHWRSRRRGEVMDRAAEIARHLAGWPDEIAS